MTDVIKRGELSTEWFPGNDMVADFMIKPLQGKLFTKFHDLVMGIKLVSFQ